MRYNFRFTGRALRQQEEIITWYAERSTRAAAGFVEGLHKVLQVICSNPYLYRNTYKDFREFYWKKYRYHIIFLVDDDKREVVVFSLYHSSRNPKKKYDT